MSTDPLALRPDGTALDPAAFRAAALADPRISRDLADDPDTRAVLESGDDGAIQELLKAVHVVWRACVLCVWWEGGAWWRTPTMAAVMFHPPPFLSSPPPPPLSTGRNAPRRACGPHHVGAHHRRPARVGAGAAVRECGGGRERGRPRDRTHTQQPTPLPFSLSHTHSDTVQLYQQLADAGLQYGPAFRLLRNVHVPEVE